MSECPSIHPLVTAYVDGELKDGRAGMVERHLQSCPACQSRVARERSVHDVLQARRQGLRSDRASDRLRTACAQVSVTADVRPSLTWRARAIPLALAAMLTVVVSGGVLYRLTQTSVRVMAAELAVDHMKCSLVNRALGTRHEHREVRDTLASAFDWQATLPVRPETAGLELVGARPCLYGEGLMAHVMYTHEGRPVSVFMLPGTERPDDLIEVLGHQAVVWSSEGRTFVLMTRGPQAEARRIAAFLHETLR